MGLAEVISARPYRLGASPIAYAALQCFSAYNAPAYTEALVCMSGVFSNLSEIVDRTTCPGPCSQFREIGLNGYMARGADQAYAGASYIVTWSYSILTDIQLGGNAPFKKFMKEYPAEGGWNDGMNPYDTYHSWAATQYRAKVGSHYIE